jgi:tRNA pseudouridine55 synthase
MPQSSLSSTRSLPTNEPPMGRKTKDSGVDGLLVVDKPAGWTSHDVVAKCRGVFRQKRAGHSGTLDPDATGVLLIGFGHVTKVLSLLTALPKTYTGEIVLGSSTSTLDASGDVLHTYDMSAVTLDEVRAAAATFVGDMMQVPPMVSAVQIDGKRLHELARQGIEVDRPARPVTVYRYEVHEAVAPGVFSITVECSSGTYVRTLAADVGTALGGGAHLRNLRRTAIGSFTVEAGVPVDDALGSARMLTPADALRDYPFVVVDPPTAAMVANGRMLPVVAFETAAEGGTINAARASTRLPGSSASRWGVRDAEGELLAVYEAVDEVLAKPAIVLPMRQREP